ncbi:reverse transcriptase domain-containing protein [Tanacetum coccineum]
MPNNVKTYDGTGDPEDHVKIFQAAAQVEHWAMPTWCHMFNSTLIGTARVWFDELPPESIDEYKGLKTAFLAYFIQQKKYVKDPVEIHNIKQRDGETIEDFIEWFKIETGRMKGAPEYMRISGFMHGVNNPELIRRLNENVLKTMEEMMTVTTAFIRGEVAAASKKKSHTAWKPQDHTKRQGKFKPPPPKVTPVEKRSNSKFYEFHNDKGHNTDECVQLKKQIEELVRAGKLSRFIKEIRTDKDHRRIRKNEAPAKDKVTAIYMIQSWQRTTRHKITQIFDHVKEVTFPPLTVGKGTEGPLVIKVEIGGHAIHRIAPLTGFSGEIIWPLGQLRLLVTIGDAKHSAREWMNFLIVRSPSSYNVTIRSTIVIPTECATIKTVPINKPKKQVEIRHENVKISIHPDFPDQEVAIGGTRSTKGRMELCVLLKENLDIFVWRPSDITGVPRSIAEHRLNIREGYPPVRQKKRVQAPKRAKAIQVEV